MIYIDSSALAKLLFEEPESSALSHWLAEEYETPKVSSDFASVELLRTCYRIGESLVHDARQLLEGIDLVPISHAIVEVATILIPRKLGSLDAIHLASALSLKEDLTDFVAYDADLCLAAADAELPVVSPR
ncbi:type II toxin-antitoxin system VapC family toxin [Ferrimicrobium sp.]|uniref:type II toxin-antitoxin system VapC family toxin n=1 Tax=Ferrimicrobium sp. TaxID=2926050 RepID=UPI0026358990|nr:type II toxin-antitoxin system VapC family toxin [Ferrimicrobium sp.]